MVTKTATFKLGRLARSHDKRIPMLHTLMAGKALEPVVPSVDYTKGMPSNLGMMKNDTLGDCTCAAFYHAMQVWSFNAGKRSILSRISTSWTFMNRPAATNRKRAERVLAGMSSTSLLTSSTKVHRAAPTAEDHRFC